MQKDDVRIYLALVADTIIKRTTMPQAPLPPVLESDWKLQASNEDDRRTPPGKIPVVQEGPSVSIVIPTFRRPDELKKAVRSCLGQSTYNGAPFEIVVVDNSPEGSARAVVHELDADEVPLHYVCEPRPGISRARNRGLAVARGDLIAMIDDDEVAATDWLFNLTRAQRMFDADVVFGPVHPEFDQPLGKDDEFLTAFYTYALPLPTGSVVGVRATNNALIRRAALDGEKEPFDTELGLTGGEDTLFFSVLQAKGARFIWSAEAIVKETIPPDRIQWSNVWYRAFQRGQCRASTPMLLPRPRLDKTLFWMAIGVIQVLFLLPIVAVLWFPNRQLALYCLWKLVSGLGKVFWMRLFRQRVYGGIPLVAPKRVIY